MQERQPVQPPAIAEMSSLQVLLVARMQARGLVQPPATAAMSSLRVLQAARMRGCQPE